MTVARTAARTVALTILALPTLAAEPGAQARPPAPQPTPARFMGTVTDASTGRPVAGARIAIAGTTVFVVTDSLGRFDITGIAPGLSRFGIFAEGFPRSNFVLAFATGETMERRLELDSTQAGLDTGTVTAQPIEPVTIAAERPMDQRYRDFERRRSTGRGQYMTRDQIERAGFSRLTDVMRAFRGVNVECSGGSSCWIRMARAPRGCLPEYVVDGHTTNTFGGSTPIRDIEALEVYVGASDVPGEFAGTNAGCGVIVIWTRNGPPRGRRP